ncbi:PREDICTED: uncharacterized protein LOC109583484 [Amphimedon queenslandica]|uniref:Uncharacterized protein n=1 Tax=Amphimedon queenslandica TaxID=400682 RepID=A0A1X7UH38_AMPQE|nr:PREDICTED: uncharacterized protein LOC109583484 [Amphimedon queenslandica]|eukprot:XP_019854425.1 PREDICTED: uncharacterized protein LOC109583484 [Amphimedon queenslandica]
MSAKKMLLVVVLLRTYFSLLLLVALVVLDKAFANVELACPRLSVPPGTSTIFYCSTNDSSSGLDIRLAGNPPDVPIYGSVQEGHTMTRGLLTVSVVEKTSAILRVAISFNVSLPLLNTYLTCTSITNGEYDSCLLSYPRPRLDPHATVLCEDRNEDNRCSLTSLSWNCSKSQLPLKEVEVWLDGDEKANVSQSTCTHYFRVNGTRPFVNNLTLVGHYVTNYSSTVTALIDLQSPFQISKNESKHGSTTYIFDVVEERKPSRLLELNVVRSDNITIQKEDAPPLYIEVFGNKSITYSLRTFLINGDFLVLYEQNGTQSFESGPNTNGTNTTPSGTSALKYCLLLVFLYPVLIIITSLQTCS